MSFSQKLNDYMNILQCSSRELAACSRVSAATISRYRAGARVPAADSPQLQGIASGLAKAAAQNGRRDMDEMSIKSALLASLSSSAFVYDPTLLRINLNALMDRLHLNAKETARGMDLDYSAFFRIRAGQRNPAHPEAFCRLVADYVASRMGDELSRDILADLVGCAPAELEDPKTAAARVADWLVSGKEAQREAVRSFLLDLDRFDLPRYIEQFHPRTGEAPSEGDVQGAENAFIRALQPPTDDDVAFVCTDMFREDLRPGGSSIVNLPFLAAVLIGQGYRVRLVLNADRPIERILPGLKALMPVFMSGRLEAYYLKGRNDGVYLSRLISLPDAAVSLQAINGHEDCARADTAKTPEDVRYYRCRAEQIFANATPLLEIIDRDEERRKSILKTDAQKPGKRWSVLSTPPLYTVSDALLKKILSHNAVTSEEADRIRDYIHSERARMQVILGHSAVTDRIPKIGAEDYKQNAVFLSLSGLYYEKELLCTYEEYTEHLSLTAAFEREHANYRCIADEAGQFRNIQIFMNVGAWVMLSKNRFPAIHILIRHPKLRESIEQMLLLYDQP